jgi:hypothetical protein
MSIVVFFRLSTTTVTAMLPIESKGVWLVTWGGPSQFHVSVYCTDITSPTLISRMFQDAVITVSSLSNLPCLTAPDSSLNSLIQSLITHNTHRYICIQNITVHLMGRMGPVVQWSLMSVVLGDGNEWGLKYVCMIENPAPFEIWWKMLSFLTDGEIFNSLK